VHDFSNPWRTPRLTAADHADVDDVPVGFFSLIREPSS
jgi:hypothetical protein